MASLPGFPVNIDKNSDAFSTWLFQFYQYVAALSGSGSGPILTTKGDLLTYASGEVRLGVGSNGQVLTADSTATDGIKWASLPTGSYNIYTGSVTIANSSSGTVTISTGASSQTAAPILVTVSPNDASASNYGVWWAHRGASSTDLTRGYFVPVQTSVTAITQPAPSSNNTIDIAIRNESGASRTFDVTVVLFT